MTRAAMVVETIRKIQLCRFELDRAAMRTILTLEHHDNLVRGDGSLTQNLPASWSQR